MGNTNSRDTASSGDARKSNFANSKCYKSIYANINTTQHGISHNLNDDTKQKCIPDSGNGIHIPARRGKSSTNMNSSVSKPIPTNAPSLSSFSNVKNPTQVLPKLDENAANPSFSRDRKVLPGLSIMPSPSQNHACHLQGDCSQSKTFSSSLTVLSLPTYNSINDSEDVGCGSLVLRSYRQHSFARTAANSYGISSPVCGSEQSQKLSFSSPNWAERSVSLPCNSLSTTHSRYLAITGHPIGLENYGNTCYYNSVIQLLYHCVPLRLRLLELQDLYTSKKGGVGFETKTPLYHLCSLFAAMHRSNNRPKQPPNAAKPGEVVDLRPLLKCVCLLNGTFDVGMQQDAHEFAMFLLNNIIETEKKMMTDPKNCALFAEDLGKKKPYTFWKKAKDKMMKSSRLNGEISHSTHAAAPPLAMTGDFPTDETDNSAVLSPKVKLHLSPLESILKGLFCSLTACFHCGKVSTRDELFMDLSVDTKQGCSLLHCLHHLGDRDYFYGKNKLRCGKCDELVCAAKTIYVQKLPQYALLVHLKRFWYDAKKQTYTKTFDHVAVPTSMDLEEYGTEISQENPPDGDSPNQETDFGESDTNTISTSGPPNPHSTQPSFKNNLESVRQMMQSIPKNKARFELTGFIAHRGQGSSTGHYFTCIRYNEQLWYCFDDKVVTIMTARDVEQFYGIPSNLSKVVSTTAYILLYERVA